MKRNYTIVFQPIPPDEGTGFYAHVPALGITSNGDTIEEAREMAQDAIEGLVETALEHGIAIPSEASAEL